MKSNFCFLENHYQYLADLGKSAEQLVYYDADSSNMKMRLLAEKITEIILKIEGLDNYLSERQIDRIDILDCKGLLPDSIISILHALRKIGNKAVHDSQNSSTSIGLKIIQLGFYLACWFMEVYVSFDFKKPSFHIPEDINQLKENRIKELEEQLVQQKQQYMQMIAALPSDVDNQMKRKVISLEYAKNHPLNEEETRVLIDQQLNNSGFKTDTQQLNYKLHHTMPKKGEQIAIAEWPCGTGYADYALFDDCQLIGIVEAKKYGKDISGDLQQAKEYAKNIEEQPGIKLCGNWNGYKVPFIYSTNGRPYLAQLAEKSGIWFWDVRTPSIPSKPLEQWHQVNDLKQKLMGDIEKANEQLLEDNHYPDFAGRYYQKEAIQAVEQALSQGKHRMLLAMATGTGKTRTALALMYRLIKFKRARRILFLVDRRSLGIQTEDALQDTKIDNLSFSDIYDIAGLSQVTPDIATKIHIATVQGMVKRLFHQEKEKDIPSVGSYDFIIVDEAHRGYKEDKELDDNELRFYEEQDYVSQYRRVIDYFDADVLGLTATPALHTTNIFGLPIYNYTYTEAVVDGYLVDHNPPIKFETELNRNGIQFEKDEEVTLWDQNTHQLDKARLEDNMSFDIDSFNTKVITESFNRVITEELVNYIDPLSDEKTLIFAARDSHADMIVRLLKEAYIKHGVQVDDDAIIKITNSVHNQDLLIKRFKNEQFPNIVVTVDLLTTGIDVPKITNLVFMRRVKSRILYEQMLGRATRLCPEINKEAFNIFDAVRLYDALENVTNMKPLVQQPNIKASMILEKAIQAEDDESFVFYKEELIAKLQRKRQTLNDQEQDELCQLNNIQSIDNWLHELKDANQEVLRSQQEKILRLSEYKKMKDAFIVSEQSDQLLDISYGYGDDAQSKPGDYLEEFHEFIQNNMDKIPALELVVKRPRDLTIRDLKEIRLELKRHNFNETDLQQAWSQVKQENIAADIISFIRQVALGTKLVSHEERIKYAMKQVYALNNQWTPSQRKWLERIEKQLMKENVLGPTAEEAFNDNTIFHKSGGYKRMKQLFGEYTVKIIDTINDYLYV